MISSENREKMSSKRRCPYSLDISATRIGRSSIEFCTPSYIKEVSKKKRRNISKKQIRKEII